MIDRYEKCKVKWNKVFGKKEITIPTKIDTGNEVINKALDWTCFETHTILDFGCGNGSMLFYCALRGTKKHMGIDLSSSAIVQAKIRQQKMSCGAYDFIEGGIEALYDIESSSVDAIILSNIIDNLYPEDADKLMREIKRILKNEGKVFIKVNPYINDKQIKEWNIKTINENLLDDGLYLWNQITEEWKCFLQGFLVLEKYQEVYYPEYDQYNRLFLMTK